MRRHMMSWILSSLGMFGGKIGESKQMFMAMEAPLLGERRDMGFGLTLPKTSTNIPFFGPTITLCKFFSVCLNETMKLKKKI